MRFIDEIIELENYDDNDDFVIIKGIYPILITAAHTIEHKNQDGTLKLREPFTKAIALYLAKKLNVYAVVKIKNTNKNSNEDIPDTMKNIIVNMIKENNISLCLDIHGASISRNFDIELGTINNISADFSTINELKESFEENGIKNISVNTIFKGGAITRTIYGKTDAEAIQIEINRKYRNLEFEDNIEKLCLSLEKFLRQYINIIMK